MKKNTNRKGQTTGKDRRSVSLKQQIIDLEALKVSIGVHVKELETLVHQPRVILEHRITDSELHKLWVQIADLKALLSIITKQLDFMKNVI